MKRLTLEGDAVILFINGAYHPTGDYIAAMLDVLRDMEHPRFEEFDERWLDLPDDAESEDALLDDLTRVMEEIAPEGYRWSNGDMYIGEEGWNGWIRTV